MNILLGVSGGIAAYKAPHIASLLRKRGHAVRVAMTKAAGKFVKPLTFQTISCSAVADSLFDETIPHEVQHIAWAEWADLAVVAPATANTIGKLAHGIADNVLTTILLATTAPVVVVPAMNSNMLANSAVADNLAVLVRRGIDVMPTDSGLLACGVTGPGRMPEPEQIVRYVLRDDVPLAGFRVLVTAGPTSEPIDPVRSITNRSSGKMGYALAEAAFRAGGNVKLISGPVSIPAPAGVPVKSVQTAEQMFEAVMRNAPEADIIIACAAVSDYTPVRTEAQKIKKTDEELTLRLHRTPDILATLGQDKTAYLVGFAAETENLMESARSKLCRKNLDMIVANDVSRPEIGFESENNAVTILTTSGINMEVPEASKQEIAQFIVRQIAADLKRRDD